MNVSQSQRNSSWAQIHGFDHEISTTKALRVLMDHGDQHAETFHGQFLVASLLYIWS